ncbi:MAG: cation-transporting P-type ATPase [Candidatus Lokiarchaeota archaeon]|nr:cation-transporting P-type ATPase [Candidatus Harpocratesius repetitus]
MATIEEETLARPITPFYSMELSEIIKLYNADPKTGLSPSQVEQNLTKYGLNELKKVKRSFYKVVIAPIINLLIIIYLVSAFLMWILGDIQRTVPTFIILGANAIVAIVQQLRAEKQLQALKQLSEATTYVLRNGEYIELPTSKITVGDIVQLHPGDKIPADCRIIEARNLSIDEASLTGESEPVKKSIIAHGIDGIDIPLQDQKNMLFLGTFVASGECTAIVVRVGSETEIGKISTKLEESTTGDIPLRKKMNHIAIYLGIGVVFLLISSVIYKLYIYWLHDEFIWEPTIREGIIDSIDLGMKIMPINLPLLTTIVLLTGVLTMAQKGVIVREISRTESLGRVSVVCTDKTGTLTKNEMTVVHVWTPDAEYKVDGEGYSYEGNIIKQDDNKTININSHDTHLALLIESGHLNNNCQIQQRIVKTLRKDQKEKLTWDIMGLPTEAALKVLAKKYHPDIDALYSNYQFLLEFSFDSSIKRMSKVFRTPENTNLLFCKGATEWILPLCSKYRLGEEEYDMNEEMRNIILERMKEFAAEGYRILSLTYRRLTKSIMTVDFESDNAREHYERDLTYLGFVVILDPPREDVYSAVDECKKANVDVIMITGDSISTGKAIAEKIGLFDPEHDLAREGNQIETLSDEDFLRTKVYGRVSPEHKQIIVSRFQAMDKIVSMSGDGVNDALALSMADCGLAMGIQGTEVAKEAADMIITDDSFSTIVTGIKEGRGLFMKIRSIIYFFVLVSVMEAIILFTSTLNPANPDFQMWYYWQLNLIYLTAHFFPSFGFTFGKNAKTVMEEPPRNSAEIITPNILKILAVQLVLMGAAIAIAYYFCMFDIIHVNDVNLANIGYPGSIDNPYPKLPPEKVEMLVNPQIIKARTMGFLVLFITESVIMPLQIRRINYSLLDSLKDLGWLEFLFYLPSLIIFVIGIYSLPLQQFMGETLNITFYFTALSFSDWVICILLCLPSTIAFELIRVYARKKKIFF